MLHDKADGVATFSTTKTMTDISGRSDIKRRRALIVEWAQSFVVGPTLTECYKLRYHINDIRGIHDLINSRLVYHVLQKYIFFC